MNHTELLLERWEAIHEIENLMGRRAFKIMTVQEDEVFETMWSKNEPCLGLNNGYYKGYEAVAGYFRCLHERQCLRAEAAARSQEALAGKNAEELFGVGAFHGHNLTTPVIELAGDMKTAKGIWYVLDGDVDYRAEGYSAFNCLGRIGVDFIHEDGQWKIWHLVYAEDICVPMGTAWTTDQKAGEVTFAELAAYELPGPNVPQCVHEHWHKDRQMRPFPPLPVPYESFDQTFSYGV